jgi:hypothetical protein
LSSEQESAPQANYDAVVVSAFGRGELLASELKTRGLRVVLIDVSEALGVRQPADLEGPFPIVRPNPLLPAHLEWLMSHSFEEIPNGVCLWQPSGPVEFRGQLADFYAKRADVSLFRDFFLPPKSSSIGKWFERGFADRWILEFSHCFCSNEFATSTECHLKGEPFPFLQPVQMPIFRTDRLERVQEELLATGLELIRTAALGEVSSERGRVTGLQVGDRVLSSDSFVWCLSSEETHSISRTLAKKMFPNGVVPARWVWRRFQVHSPKSPLDTVVPPYAVLIDDIFFPWSYENMIVLKRRKPGLGDIWVRLPSENSRKPDQLQNFTKKVEEKLRQRFDMQYEVEPFWDEGPPLYPVFESEQLRAFSKPPFSNVIFEGPEVLARQDWAGRFQIQSGTMLNILSKKKKEKSDDIAVHAP